MAFSSEVHKTRFKELYTQGLNDRQIGEIIGVPKDTIRYWRVVQFKLPPTRAGQGRDASPEKELKLCGERLTPRGAIFFHLLFKLGDEAYRKGVKPDVDRFMAVFQAVGHQIREDFVECS